MSTTLSVLHVLMADNDHALDVHSSTSPPSLFSSSMASLSSLAGLDPVLADFWSAFPCPPPWNTALLFRVNWTMCVGQAVGEKLKWFLADRCKIPIEGDHGGSGGGFGGGGAGGGGGSGGDGGLGGFGDHVSEDDGELCDMACKILVSLFSILVVIGLVIAGVLILHRHRIKRKDQRVGQQTGGAGGDRRTQYTGIHYASANVLNRENERPLPPCPEAGENGMPRQLKAYVYNPRDNDQGPPDLHFHLHLCPMNRRAAYRVMEPSHSSSASQANSDTSHVYDYISDTESVRWRGGGVGGSVQAPPRSPDYYCTCDTQHGNGSVSVVGAECNSNRGYHLPVQQRQSEGYYSDHDHNRAGVTDHSSRPARPDYYPEHFSYPKDFSQPGWRVDNVDGDMFEGLDGNANMPTSFRNAATEHSQHEDTEEEPGNGEEVDVGGKRVNALALHPDYFADYFDHRGSSSA